MKTRTIIWTALGFILIVIEYSVITFLSIGGGSKTETITIEQVSSSYNYKIKAPLKANQHVHNLKIVVQGNLNDTALIGNKKLVPGTVDTVIYNYDWYSPDYELEYKSYRATEGNSSVELVFSYLD